MENIEHASGHGTAEYMFQAVRRHVATSMGATGTDSLVQSWNNYEEQQIIVFWADVFLLKEASWICLILLSVNQHVTASGAESKQKSMQFSIHILILLSENSKTVKGKLSEFNESMREHMVIKTELKLWWIPVHCGSVSQSVFGMCYVMRFKGGSGGGGRGWKISQGFLLLMPDPKTISKHTLFSITGVINGNTTMLL